MRTFRAVIAHLFHPQRSNNHRARVLHPDVFIFYAMLGIGFAVALQFVLFFPQRFDSVLGYASSITPQQVITQTNQERAQLGLPPVVLNQTLSQAALSKGQDMLSDQYWSHVSPDGKEPWFFIKGAGYDYQVAGENLARDFATTDQMVAAWMASPTHRANIANPRYQEIGVAVIDGSLLGVETTLVVQMFGTERALAQATTPTNNRQQPQVIAVEASDDSAQFEPALNQVANDQGDQFIDPSQLIHQVGPAALITQLAGPASGEVGAGTTVLSRALVPVGSIQAPPLFSPLQLAKAFFLALILFITLTLVYDSVVIGNYSTMRIVGKNVSHIIFLVVIAFLLLLFKGGMVG